MAQDPNAKRLAQDIHEAVRRYEEDTGKRIRVAGIGLNPQNDSQWQLTLLHRDDELKNEGPPKSAGDIFTEIFGNKFEHGGM